jgi:hypothetical protein
MCKEMRRAEACVDRDHALVNGEKGYVRYS